MTPLELLAEVERQGGSLALAGNRIRYRLPRGMVPRLLEELRAHREEVLAELRKEAQPLAIPAGALLIAPRYDGYGRPLREIPKCSCCRTPWVLERLQEWKSKTYAFLEPACGCLDVPQALAGCGLCLEHCRCAYRKPTEGRES